jgi:hypothetical protein
LCLFFFVFTKCTCVTRHDITELLWKVA